MSRIFHLFLIKPSHYDDDGYVIQWARSSIPANTLATLNGLALDCAERRVLGEDVEIRVTGLGRDQHADPRGSHYPANPSIGRKWTRPLGRRTE